MFERDGESARLWGGALAVLAIVVAAGAVWVVLRDGGPTNAPSSGLAAERGSPEDARAPTVSPPEPTSPGVGPVSRGVDAGAMHAVLTGLDAGNVAPRLRADAGVFVGTASIFGEVRDAGLRAVPGARLRVTRKEAQSFYDVATVTSDGAGRYRVEAIAAGSYVIEVRAAGHRPKVVEGVVLAEGEALQLDVQLDAGARIAGLVLDDAQEPVGGAEVTLVPPPDDTSGDQVRTTGRDGRFAFEEAGAGPYCLYGRKSPYVDAEQCGVRPGVELVLKLGRAGAVSGRVVRALGGAPISAFTISARREGPARDTDMAHASKRFRSATGEFTLGDLQAGTYTLSARAEGRLFAERAGIEVRPGETTSGVVFELGGGTRVGGAVVSAATSQPIEGAKVELWLGGRAGGGTRRTDALGRFEFESVSHGRHQINVEHDAHHPVMLMPIAPGAPVTVRLRPR